MTANPSPRRGRPALGVLAAAAAVAILVAGCAAKDDAKSAGGGSGTTTTAPPPGVSLRNLDDLADEGTPQDGGKLVFGLEAETDGGFNTSTGRFAASGHYVASAVYDPLATLDERGNAVPYLAESFDHNADFTSWTVTIRDGVTFHDGTPFTAEDVKRNFDETSKSIVVGLAWLGLQDVTVASPTQVRLTFDKPWSMFPSLLTTQVGYMMAKSMFTDPTLASKPVGTGPFVFKDWQTGVSFKAVKNEHYWQAGKPHLSEIELRPIPNAQARADALASSEVDAMHTITGRDILSLRDKPDLKMIEVETGEEVCIAMNEAKAPFDELDARLAMAYATDVRRFLQETGRDIAQPANGPFAPGQLGYRQDSTYPQFDLAKAKEHVAAYEKKTGKKLAFEYQGAANTDDAAAQQLLKSMWEAAGMEVELVGTPQVAQIVNAVLGNYQAIDWRNFGAADFDGDALWFRSSSIKPEGQISLNVVRFSNPTIDEALAHQRTTLDRDTRDRDFATVAKVLDENVPFLWLERAHWTIATSPEVHGFGMARNGSIQTLGAKTWVADLWLSQ